MAQFENVKMTQSENANVKMAQCENVNKKWLNDSIVQFENE